MSRFEGKTAFLTGAGSGIGQAVSVKLASEGAVVTGFDISEEGLAATGTLIESAGGTFHPLVGDVRSRQVCHDAVGTAVERMGRLDVLGNIAGIARAEHVADVTEEAWHQMVDINLSGVFFMAQAGLPHLVATNGSLINIASNAGLMGQAFTVAYCATKGAVVNMTRALAMEYIKTGVRINAIAPGGVETTLTNTFQIPADIDFELMGRYTATRGMLSAESLANVFAFVASDEGSAMHGAIVSADNGITAG